MIALACALAFNVTDAIQRALPDYPSAAQRKIEDSDTARQQLSGLYDNSDKELSRCEDGVNELRSCGKAPAVEGISKWLNTPGGAPVTLESLRGKVVLNAGNVADQAKKLGVTCPVALDNKLSTWNNYRNRFWPAKYLIDADGTVRYFNHRARNVNVVLSGEGPVQVSSGPHPTPTTPHPASTSSARSTSATVL
ncbi:hypothetical protein [Streptomyces sp. NPDC091212]|uniref:hypothetical protein n=1 Tax=Streptomyces sp. NPDC091212 TaxID=3155191 RepID=UPI00342D2C33